jgi:hypothetical protein
MLKRNTFIGCFARAISRSPGLPCAWALFLSIVSLFGLVGTSHAQAIPTAEKNGQLDAFGLLSITSPDYAPAKDVGATIGGDFLMRSFIFGQPGIAARYTYVHGPTVNETFIGAGVELHYRYRMLKPYATLLYGVGGLAIPAAANYYDSGNTFLIGGGADYPVSRRLSARGEFTYSFVDITGYHNTPVGAISLTPWSINLGVVYHIR